jgi:hypothetical protein
MVPKEHLTGTMGKYPLGSLGKATLLSENLTKTHVLYVNLVGQIAVSIL